MALYEWHVTGRLDSASLTAEQTIVDWGVLVLCTVSGTPRDVYVAMVARNYPTSPRYFWVSIEGATPWVGGSFDLDEPHNLKITYDTDTGIIAGYIDGEMKRSASYPSANFDRTWGLAGRGTSLPSGCTDSAVFRLDDYYRAMAETVADSFSGESFRALWDVIQGEGARADITWSCDDAAFGAFQGNGGTGAGGSVEAYLWDHLVPGGRGLAALLPGADGLSFVHYYDGTGVRQGRGVLVSAWGDLTELAVTNDDSDAPVSIFTGAGGVRFAYFNRDGAPSCAVTTDDGKAVWSVAAISDFSAYTLLDVQPSRVNSVVFALLYDAENDLIAISRNADGNPTATGNWSAPKEVVGSITDTPYGRVVDYGGFLAVYYQIGDATPAVLTNTQDGVTGDWT